MKKTWLVISVAIVCGLCACSAHEPDNSTSSNEANETQTPVVVQKITAEQTKAMMEDGDAFILLDVRTAEEYNESHIDDALLIPDTELARRAGEALPDQDARILVYCRSGRRSAAAAQMLVDMGYTDVYDFGGIIDWPYETVSG